MTFQELLMNKVHQIDLLLHFLPECDSSNQRDSIMQEVNILRRRVTEIEEMTKTEKQRDIKLIKMTIESKL